MTPASGLPSSTAIQNPTLAASTTTSTRTRAGMGRAPSVIVTAITSTSIAGRSPSRDEVGWGTAVAFQVQTAAGRAWRLSKHLGAPHGRARASGNVFVRLDFGQCRTALNIYAVAVLARTRWTVTFCQRPFPLGVGTPRSLSTRAIPVALVIPPT